MHEQGERSKGHRVGVCHLTARATPGTDVALLKVRLVMTTDVAGADTLNHNVVGPDAACDELRAWMERVCATGVATPRRG